MAKEQQREQECEEERKHYEQEKEEERRRYDERQAAERMKYEGLIRELTERRPRRIGVGPELLKLTKLTEADDIDAFLITFERAVEAHGQESGYSGTSADQKGPSSLCCNDRRRCQEL